MKKQNKTIKPIETKESLQKWAQALQENINSGNMSGAFLNLALQELRETQEKIESWKD